MTSLWFAGVLLAATATLAVQSKTPAFLAGAAPEAALVTAHLEARAASDVRIRANGTATLTVLVTPRPRMHVYAADVEGYVPFTLTVQPRPGVTVGTVTYPAHERYVFPPTGESSRAYMRPFTVTVPLTFTADARAKARSSPVGIVTLRYQACDDAVCYRPVTGSFTFRIAE